ncbi:MAG TPA: hypothetical protein VN376_10625, partial [Longilinea sp.]|nr:hypothetical protein [Longilinea sp.]
KYREFIKDNDSANLEYYRSAYKLKTHSLANLDKAVQAYKHLLHGVVVWDPDLIDSVNIALMLAAQENLLVIGPTQIDWAKSQGLEDIRHDLRGRFKDRVAAYAWALKELFPRCKPGQIASLEPAWKRSEFTDYIVQNKLFTYCLTSFEKGGVRNFGQTLLMILIGGPFGLRNFLFNTHLDGLVKGLARLLLSAGSAETRLGHTIQRKVKALPFPTIFGWHSDRDDEMAFMLQISMNGMRLAPTFMAGNYSFHSKLPVKVAFKQHYIDPARVNLEDKVYLTFTLSDGDQFTLMNTGELGNWRRSERGKVAFNWEMQPLLAEIAPALLGYYYSSLKDTDLLVAGPSGAGYIIPPLANNLPAYMAESAHYCDLADVRVTTSYIADPPMRVVKDHGKAPGKFLGYLAGYFHLGRTPMYMADERPFVAYSWPKPDQIPWESDQVLEGIRALIENPAPTPRFIACHLFAYFTTITDVYNFVQTLDKNKVKVVRADEFLSAAAQAMQNNPSMIGKPGDIK